MKNSGLSRLVTRLCHTDKAFRAYALPRCQGPIDKTRMLFEEVRPRFWQMIYAVDRMRALEEEIEAVNPDTCSRDEAIRKAAERRYCDIHDEVGFYLEALYLFAWRTRVIIQQLPGLHAFDPRGVRDVRNQLIEHPEQCGGDLSRGLGFCNEQFGPSLRGGDKGLVSNVEEFCDELLRRIGDTTTTT